ncbi:MAG: 4Fe-4S dicluster domain-containing protein [Methanomassiliicoccus sp.]|nr:MAG: 4Fe-4S dicluster domain-containing protein [Methanomassiliicoccus sp.]
MLNVRLIRKGFRYRSGLARLTRVPLIGKLMDRVFFDGDDIYVLPKEPLSKTTEIFVDLVVPGRDDTVLPSEVVRHFVERSRYHFLMNGCICRTSAHCQDYPRELGCLFLGKATLKIDPRLGHMVSKEEALAHLDRCEEAGLVHLIGRNKIDSVWMSAGPKEDLMTICNCCPCCCLWKMLPQLARGISGKLKRLPGVSLSVDAEKCTGCGLCSEGCYVGAIDIVEGEAVIDQNLCKGCARCAHTCPERAITLHMEDADFLMHAVQRLEPLVDVTKE